MKYILFTLCIFSASLALAQNRNSVVGFDNVLLGGFTNGKWVSANEVSNAASLRYNADGSLLALICNWNAEPRKATALNTNHATYNGVVKDYLARNGLPNATSHIVQLFRIDLEGDGVDEIVIVAQNIMPQNKVTEIWASDKPLYAATDIPIAPSAGQYSIALLRKIVKGKVVEIPLGQYIALKSGNIESGDFTPPLIHKVFQFADLNGDGVMEIIVGDFFYEGYSYGVYNIKDDKATLVLGYEESDASEHSETGTVTYNGKPFSQLLGSSGNDVVRVMGAPEGTMQDDKGAIQRIDYNGIHFWFNDGILVRAESYDAGKLAIDGVTLNKNRAELIKALGAPEKEGREAEGYYGSENVYIMKYRLSNGVVLLEFEKDFNVPPGMINIQI